MCRSGLMKLAIFFLLTTGAAAESSVPCMDASCPAKAAALLQAQAGVQVVPQNISNAKVVLKSALAAFLRKDNDALEKFLGQKGGQPLSEGMMLMLRECFESLDTDRSGKIDKHEFRKAFANSGMQVSDKEMNMMVDQADINGDGEIDFDEFVKLMTS
eukprot:symbB.v1.2.027051.t1/scaffold2747.1/size71700/5